MDLKAEIKRQLKVVPKSVISGGLMTSVHWKEKAVKAQKMLSQPNAKRSDLQDILDQLRQFQ
jgi:hypothetical protein